MPRNLDRRVELLFPVGDPRLRQAIVEDVLQVHLYDNVQARRLRADGSYERLWAQPDTAGLDSQAWLVQHWKTRREWHTSQAQSRARIDEPAPRPAPYLHGSNGAGTSAGGERIEQ